MLYFMLQPWKTVDAILYGFMTDDHFFKETRLIHAYLSCLTKNSKPVSEDLSFKARSPSQRNQWKSRKIFGPGPGGRISRLKIGMILLMALVGAKPLFKGHGNEVVRLRTRHVFKLKGDPKCSVLIFKRLTNAGAIYMLSIKVCSFQIHP